MVYEYNSKIVNRNKVDDFFSNRSFVGYILPDGTIFACQDHNVSDANTFLWMYLEILDHNYDKKDELLDAKTDNKLLELLDYHLKKMSHDEIHALYEYIYENNVFLSDLLVSFFGCHLITRLDREILTSEIDYHCFYNYLLNDFKITNVGKLVYDKNEKKYKHIYPIVRNEYLYDEIKRIKKEVKEDEIELFYKSK